jgi:hypothetical protein
LDLGGQSWWVVSRAAIDNAIDELVGRRIHEHFPGYLCMVWTAARSGRADELRPDFRGFHDYFLRVPGRDKFPYLRPFQGARRRTGAGAHAVWYQANVAGSYAPSSIRGGGTLPKVISVAGSGSTARYALRPGHAKLALQHLAYGAQIPLVPLALYLYREFAFDEPSAATVAATFRYEFGYEDRAGDKVGTDLEVLYTDDSDVGATSGLFEEFTA